MRQPKFLILFSFFFTFVSLIIPATSNQSISAKFLTCLETYSNTSNHPISSAFYSPWNASYSSVLHTYMRNLRFNESRKPELILTALDYSHVQSAVVCAQLHSLQMRIRSGGHDFEGLSYVSNEPFFILDMCNLRKIVVNVEEETAWVEAGATLGELYYTIGEKSDVLAFPGGTCPSVGVGGILNGAGYGNMVRKYGLAADNVIDAKILDVRGRILDRESMGEDLFWAITGGDGSSFAVVLAYKIRLVKVPSKVTFVGIRITNENLNFTNIVHKFLQVADKLHTDLFIKLALGVVKSDDLVREKTLTGTFLTLFLGNSERLLTLMGESFPELGMKKDDCVLVTWVESIVHWTNFAEGSPTSVLLSRAHPAVHMKRKSDFLKNLIPKAGLELIFKKMLELETPVLKFFPFGGVMNEISPSAKPFPHRDGNIALIEIATNWNETGAEAKDHYMSLTRKFYAYITPFVSKSRDAYLNYRDLDLGINYHGPDSYIQAKAYGSKYFKNNFDRLVKIKSKVDPENFFRNEQSIPVRPLINSM